MGYTGQQLSLLTSAEMYKRLGYRVGLTHGKTLVQAYRDATRLPAEWDGISIILDGLVCVDFDTLLHFDVGWGRELPATFKERSPHGHHLFYNLPDDEAVWVTKIKWKPDVDLLTNDDSHVMMSYGARRGSVWQRHVLVSPTPGYVRLYPDHVPELDDLPMAPNWLLQALQD